MTESEKDVANAERQYATKVKDLRNNYNVGPARNGDAHEAQ